MIGVAANNVLCKSDAMCFVTRALVHKMLKVMNLSKTHKTIQRKKVTGEMRITPIEMRLC